LSKVGDLISQTCNFTPWEELGEQRSSKLISRGDTSQWQRMQPSSFLIP